MVIYSDGVTEAQNLRDAEFFGKKRLREVVEARRAANRAPRFTMRFRRRLRAFTEGAPQSDDITLVVLEFSTA